jgi:fatty acid desaturase
MIIRNATAWRWSHAPHHKGTIIVGRDVEIALMQPPALLKWSLNVIDIVDAFSRL